MTLYAKLEKSTLVRFYDRNKLLWKMGLNEYDKGDINQIPVREGYAFAGWYTDSELTQETDFSKITSNTNVYAGWYKIIEDVFDIDKNDMGTYISYSNYKIGNNSIVENTDEVDDRFIYMDIDQNSNYYISFKVDNRFRLGFAKNKFWRYNAVSDPYIFEKDINRTNNINEYVFKTIDTKDYKKLLIYYYSYDGTKEFMDIKNTFKIYKIENTNIQENNQKIIGIDHEILDGTNQIYTINKDKSASFRASDDSLNFDYVEIDGETVNPSNYILENESIIFRKEFMDTLKPNQKHTFNLVYKDGGEASTNFYVSKIELDSNSNSNTDIKSNSNNQLSTYNKSNNNNQLSKNNMSNSNIESNNNVESNSNSQLNSNTKFNNNEKQNDNISNTFCILPFAIIIILLPLFILFYKKRDKDEEDN